MRIKSAKQALSLMFGGILQGGGLNTKVQLSGKSTASEELMWEVAITTSPYKNYSELLKWWAEYVYADNLKQDRLDFLKSKVCTNADDYSLSFIKDNTVEKYWKVTRLNEMVVADFRQIERCGRRLYPDPCYYSTVGIDRSNYHKHWKSKVDEVNTYLHSLSRRVLSPISSKIADNTDYSSFYIYD